jgi:hypothetical protein
MNSIKKITVVSYDILKGINATVWGGVEGAQKVSKIVKTGLSGADVIVGTSHTLEDLACQDYVCTALDIIGTISSTVGIVLGNIPATTPLTFVTGSVTIGCRTVRYYCKNYGTFWGCAVSGAKFIINKK